MYRSAVRLHLFQPLVVATCLTLALCLGALTGCGVGLNGPDVTQSASPLGQIVPLAGNVHGGQNPVVGARIQLYAVGLTGYNSAAVPLISSTVTTGTGGSFSITGDYTCPTGSYVYITATGGNPGLGSGNNPNLALMAALGPCSSLKASTFIFMDEVTTVAAAYALAQFSGGSAFGTMLSAKPGNSGGSQVPADNFATSSTNLQGLANAMSMAQVLANNSTGTSPGSNTNGTASVEWWQINTIADIISACVNSAGGAASDGSPCGDLFGLVNVPSGTNPATSAAYAAPVDTIQAAVYLAMSPALSASSITALYNDASASPPFLPYVPSSADITDFSVAVTYTPVVPGSTTPLLNQPEWIGIDGYGNAWVANQTTVTPYSASLLELDPTGDPVQAGTTAGSSFTNYLISSYAVNGSSTNITGEYTATFPTPVTAGYLQLAIDTTNNVWFPDANASVPSIVEVTGSASAGGKNGGNANDSGGKGAVGNTLLAGALPVAIAIDGSNDVYFSMVGPSSGAVYGSCNSTTLGSNTKGLGGFLGGNPANPVYGGNTNSEPYMMAIDGGGSYDDLTGTNTPIPGAPFVWTQNISAGTSVGPNSKKIGEIYQNYSQGTGSANTQLCSTALVTVAGPGSAGASDGAKVVVPLVQNFPASGETGTFQAGPLGLAIDNSGNLWVSNPVYDTSYGGSVFASIGKMIPNYGPAFTQANASSDFSSAIYHAVGGMSDIGKSNLSISWSPQFLAIDGGGNAWFNLWDNCSTACPSQFAGIGAITNNGASIAPSTGGGFQGSTCAGCTYNGTTSNYARYYAGSGLISSNSLAVNGAQLAVDRSGNVWVPQNAVGSSSVTVLVGAAVPVVTPLSVGIKNNSLGSKP